MYNEMAVLQRFAYQPGAAGLWDVKRYSRPQEHFVAYYSMWQKACEEPENEVINSAFHPEILKALSRP